jgi:hypothetical protein
MKLLIGGKNRNIHFRKDNSAFYKSNGQENDVSHLFKKTGGGLKKQYEEYLVSENDLTERYKALNISGGGSKSPKKKVDKADKSSKSSKAVRDAPINKKKNRGKKFLGGMTITGLRIDISGNPATLGDNFDIYIKLLGAYYLALLSDLEPSIFIKLGPDGATNTKNFHRNKLSNLLLMNFMEKDQGGGNGSYLPYNSIDKLKNLTFCYTLLNSVKKYKQSLKNSAAAAAAGGVGVGGVGALAAIAAIAAGAAAATNEAGNFPNAELPAIINGFYYQAIDISNSLSHSQGNIVQTNGVIVRNIPISLIPPTINTVSIIGTKLEDLFGTALNTIAVGNGPSIITDMTNYEVPEYVVANVANPNNRVAEIIKAQLYRVIIADSLVPAVQPAPAVTKHQLFEITPTNIAQTSLHLDDEELINSFESLYVQAANTDTANIITELTTVTTPAYLPPNSTDGNGIYADEFKEIPYTIFRAYINNNMNPANTQQQQQPTVQLTIVQGIALYFSNILYPRLFALRNAIPNSQNSKGLFAPDLL